MKLTVLKDVVVFYTQAMILDKHRFLESLRMYIYIYIEIYVITILRSKILNI